jgi:ABC-2 type transport system permease protein
MRQVMTLVHRELMEHRSSWMVTSVFGALFVLVALLSLFGLVRIGAFDDPMTLAEIAERVDAVMLQEVLKFMLIGMAFVFNVVMTFVVIFYFLDALYAERKDRSILFWKSLPVSDLQVVGSKYLTGVVAIPLLTVTVFIATAVLVSLISGVALLRAGVLDLLTGAPGAIASVVVIMLYTSIVQALWFAPFAGWLLLVSAFARRVVLGWAVLPPLLMALAERLIFGTRHFLDLVGHRMVGGYELAFSTVRDPLRLEREDVMITVFPALRDLFTPARLLAEPALWAGLVVGALLLAGAVWLRRWRDEA